MKRRSVENDYKYYDSPSKVWGKINSETWKYKTRHDFYLVRDRALMALFYLSCCRVSEVVRGKTKVGKLQGLSKIQFKEDGDWLRLTHALIIKQRWNKRKRILKAEDYPSRVLIGMPLKGGLSVFTDAIVKHLNQIGEEDVLFPFSRVRAYQIVRRCSGEFPHYFRDMGLKMRFRLISGQPTHKLLELQKFSGHQRLENLFSYLDELSLEKTSENMLKMKSFV